jgi:hypothetical protein
MAEQKTNPFKPLWNRKHGKPAAPAAPKPAPKKEEKGILSRFTSRRSTIDNALSEAETGRRRDNQSTDNNN